MARLLLTLDFHYFFASLSCRFVKYTDPDRSLIVSEVALARWNEQEATKSQMRTKQDREEKVYDPDVDLTPSDPPKPEGEEEDGAFTAVIASFSLGSSSYATMALREAMKSGTGRQEQTRLTQEHLEEAAKLLPPKRPAGREDEQPDAKRARMDDEDEWRRDDAGAVLPKKEEWTRDDSGTMDTTASEAQ